MPELDFMIVSDYVRAEGGVLHMIAGGFDTIYTPAVPAVRSIGIGLRLLVNSWELTESHNLRIIFQSQDGDRIAEFSGALPPQAESPKAISGRAMGAVAALNMSLPLPAYGDYALELLVDGNQKKTITIHVAPAPGAEIDA